MPRRFALALCLSLSLLTASCRDYGSSETKVVTIGDEPRLRDPSGGPIGPGDEVLVQAVAQGLVGFDESGDIVGALAERWNVSDDGLSYIFRLSPTKWSDGRKLTAQQVARALRRSMSDKGENPLRDTLGAVAEVVPMTDRVLEIRLRAPRPNLLAILAQPQFAVMRGGVGTGPFVLDPKPADTWLQLARPYRLNDDDEELTERVLLRGADSRSAITAFVRGEADLVLGGTYTDLPEAQRASAPRGALRFDPAAGLFGLIPSAKGIGATPAARALLSEAIDRDGLFAIFDVPGLSPRATLLEPGLDGLIAPAPPSWASQPIADRHPALIERARKLFGERDDRLVKIQAAKGPGGDLVIRQIAIDWGVLGLKVERATSARDADFVLVDTVAPSPSPAWFVRRFRCGVAPICDSKADELMDAARDTPVPAQRAALLGQAAAELDDQTLFIALGPPLRWSLVGERVNGFQLNRYARHTLVGLRGATAAQGE